MVQANQQKLFKCDHFEGMPPLGSRDAVIIRTMRAIPWAQALRGRAWSLDPPPPLARGPDTAWLLEP